MFFDSIMRMSDGATNVTFVASITRDLVYHISNKAETVVGSRAAWLIAAI